MKEYYLPESRLSTLLAILFLFYSQLLGQSYHCNCCSKDFPFPTNKDQDYREWWITEHTKACCNKKQDAGNSSSNIPINDPLYKGWYEVGQMLGKLIFGSPEENELKQKQLEEEQKRLEEEKIIYQMRLKEKDHEYREIMKQKNQELYDKISSKLKNGASKTDDQNTELAYKFSNTKSNKIPGLWNNDAVKELVSASHSDEIFDTKGEDYGGIKVEDIPNVEGVPFDILKDPKFVEQLNKDLRYTECKADEVRLLKEIEELKADLQNKLMLIQQESLDKKDAANDFIKIKGELSEIKKKMDEVKRKKDETIKDVYNHYAVKPITD